MFTLGILPELDVVWYVITLDSINDNGLTEAVINVSVGDKYTNLAVDVYTVSWFKKSFVWAKKEILAVLPEVAVA